MIKFIILGVIVLILFILIILFILNSIKLKEVKVKLDEAEDNIELILTEKYTLLSKIDKSLKKQSNEDFFEGLYDTDLDEIDNYELNKKLASYDNKILELTEYNKDLNYSDEDLKDFEKLNKVNINRLAIEKYYNDNIIVFNEVIDKFPTNIIAKFKGLKKKDSFSNEKEEIFEILKS